MGALPVIDDVIDAATIPALYALMGKFSLAGLFEFVPFADLVPTYAIAVALAYWKKKKRQALRAQYVL